MEQNLRALQEAIPSAFRSALKQEALIDPDSPKTLQKQTTRIARTDKILLARAKLSGLRHIDIYCTHKQI